MDDVREAQQPDREILLKEYEFCITSAQNLESAIWQTSAVIGIGSIGTFILVANHGSEEQPPAAVIAIIGCLIFLASLIWWFMARRWWSVQHAFYMRMRHIEEDLRIHGMRYIRYLDDPTALLKSGLKEEWANEIRYRAENRVLLLPDHQRGGVQSSLRYLPVIIFTAWTVYAVWLFAQQKPSPPAVIATVNYSIGMTWADLATIAGTILTAVGLFLLARQISLQRKEQKHQAIIRLFDEMVTPDFRRKLLFIYSSEPKNLVLENLSLPERELVEEVTARLDGLGFRVRTGLVPKTEALELFWDIALRCAQQLRPHLLNQREKRGVLCEYKEDFDWLTRECKLYHLKNLGRKLPSRNISLDELLMMDPLPIFLVEKKKA